MMRRFIAVVVSFVTLTVSTQGLQARQIRQRSTWSELSRMIRGMNIRMRLPDGTVIKGQALEVRPDELVVDVRRTSNPRLYAKGPTGIPRSDIFAIELFLRRPPGPRPDDVGAIGAGIGAVAMSPLVLSLGETDKISDRGALAMIAGAAAVGALVAHRIHGHPSDVMITVVP
jgi:hypothetical protein